MTQKVIARDIYLKDITGIHKILTAIDSSLSVPPLAHIKPDIIDNLILQNLLKITPIRIACVNKKYYCIGNLRLYKIINKKCPMIRKNLSL